MSMVDIAVTRELIRAIKGLVPPSRRADSWCWCPTGWPREAAHTESCAKARAAIYEARKAGY